MRSFKDRRPRSGKAETTEAQDRIGVMSERKPEYSRNKRRDDYNKELW